MSSKKSLFNKIKYVYHIYTPNTLMYKNDKILSKLSIMHKKNVYDMFSKEIENEKDLFLLLVRFSKNKSIIYQNINNYNIKLYCVVKYSAIFLTIFNKISLLKRHLLNVLYYNPLYFKYIPLSMKHDHDVCVFMMKINFSLFKNYIFKIFHNKKFIKMYITNGGFLYHIKKNKIKKKYALRTIRMNKEHIMYNKCNLYEDYNIIFELIKRKYNIRLISDKIKMDKNVYRKSIYYYQKSNRFFNEKFVQLNEK